MTEETTYEHEPTPKNGFKDFLAKRWVRITAISLGAALALTAAFGVGVAAGERISKNSGYGSNDNFRGGFGQMGQMPGGQMGQMPGGNFPGGCPANDPDHCAGTDRGQHGFKLPSTSGSTGSSSTTGSKS